MSILEDFLKGPYGWLSIFIVIIIFTLITIVFYIRKDKYDPEPVSRIILAFVYGLFSVIPALILSIIAQIIIGLFIGDGLIFASIIVAPPVEEIVKGWFVIQLAQSDEFDGPLDGLIYGAMVGSGFAAAENLLYGLNAFLSDGNLVTGVFVATVRSLTQIIGHPFYTGLFGVGVGEAKVGLEKSEYAKAWQSIGLHALWNFAASLIDTLFIIGLVGVIALSIIILRKELKRAIELDREAYERGYYDQKHKYLEYKRQQQKQRLRQGQWEEQPQRWSTHQSQGWEQQPQNWQQSDWSPQPPQSWEPSDPQSSASKQPWDETQKPWFTQESSSEETHMDTRHFIESQDSEMDPKSDRSNDEKRSKKDDNY